ncbi:sensor histidine kinase [Rhizorhabdus dicambivorans]|uniref:sensor histidine kinase n=1 Tax=Rhizorhabdus dicambivorans TaxID=1850238 RepID=UPI0008313777|nr:ATP-binding protein [Rhizorhabdus dicambivorans]
MPEHGRADRANARDAASPVFPSLVRLLLDQLDEGVLLLDRDDRIRLWNRAYHEMLDIPREMFVDGGVIAPLIRHLAERGDYGPGDPAALADGIAAAVRARTAAQGERQMANGSIIAAQWIPLDGGWFLFRLRDVTGERNASRFKDELIATVSHELRTPLTVISGALALLRAGTAAGEAHSGELIEVAHKNSERLARLVNDLLDIDKLQSGAPDFRFEPNEMGVLLTAAVEQNRPYADGLGIALALELPDRPVTAEVDRDRLLQVMSNLLSNAAKFSVVGSRVRVRLTPGTADLRISVIDKGRGMSEEFRRRLFTRFAQENRSSEHGQIGTGLGLAICKSIVEGHGGQIHVDTQEGVGTIFHVDLPFRQSPAG